MVVAGLVVASQAVGGAHAEETPPPVDDIGLLQSEDCRSYQPTADSAVTKAWHLDRLQLAQAWHIATGKGITVAVIDTGAAATGTPYFAGANKITTYDYLNGLSEKDHEAGGMDCDHGTKVSALIAAARPNGQPVDLRTDFSGVAPDARIISYRVLSHSGEGDERDDLTATIKAVRHATAQGVDIINLSQSAGSSDPDIPEFRQAVAEAIDAGIVVVAAAGNNDQGLSGPALPASFDGVISVGMVDNTDAPSPMSYPWRGISVGAPGAGIMTLLPSTSRDAAQYTNQAYASEQTGTSYAAPIVSGVVALMLEANPSLTPAQVKERLELTADPPPNAVPDIQIGHGVVNPLRALAGLARPVEPNAGADVTFPPDPLPEPEKPDMTAAWVGVGIGSAALLVTAMGMVVAFVVPAARRRRASTR